jgi:hypothetical protein
VTVAWGSLTEAQFQQRILDYTKITGWRVAHFRPARTATGWRTPVQADGAGFPDLIAVRADRIVSIEVKAERGRVSSEQDDWLAALTEAGVKCYVAYPADWDEIAEVLR